MATITFDKLAYVDTLKRGGFSSEQARVQADALEDALRDSVATKYDIAILKRDLIIAMGSWTLLLGGFLVAIKYFG